MVAREETELRSAVVLRRRAATELGPAQLEAVAAEETVYQQLAAVHAAYLAGAAQGAVRDKQWQRIERAASTFVGRHRSLQDSLWRFDVIACAPRTWPKHIEDAWRPR